MSVVPAPTPPVPPRDADTGELMAQAPSPLPPAAPNFAEPGMAAQPVATGLAMPERNPVAAWLLSIPTLGIYGLVWYYKIHKEMGEFDRRRTMSAAGPMLVILFLGWTVVAPLVSYYNTGKRIRNAQRSAGLEPSCSAGLGCFLMLIFGVGTFYLQSELNKIVDRYGVTAGTQVPLYV